MGDNSSLQGAVVLVTGGAGFVGSYVVEKLMALEPRKIIILDNLIRGRYENMKSFIDDDRVKFIHGDIRDETLVDELIAGSDFCFHLAALRLNACAADPREAFEVMAKATFHIIESARSRGLKKFIYSSSASVYGMAQHFPTPETDHPYDNRTFYGAAKLFGEQMLHSYCHMFGLKYISLRYFNIYGPRMDVFGKYTEVMIRWLDCIRERIPPVIYGDGSTTMDFIYVQDVAQANILALQSEASDETINIGSRKETSLKELLEMLLRIHSSPLKPVFRPESAVNPVPHRLADIDKAQKILHFAPTVSLEEGLRRLSQWYFQNWAAR